MGVTCVVTLVVTCRCLALDPTKRLDTAEALAHPYFADVEELKNAIAASEQPASVFWYVASPACTHAYSVELMTW